MRYYDPPSDTGVQLTRLPTPDRVNPRVYLACNRIEVILEERGRDSDLRRFRKYWRQYLIVLDVADQHSFRDKALAQLDPRSLYGLFWNPGLIAKSTADSLFYIRRLISEADFEEVFS